MTDIEKAMRRLKKARGNGGWDTSRVKEYRNGTESWQRDLAISYDYLEELEAKNLELKTMFDHALECVDRVFQKKENNPDPILPDFCKPGEDKFRAVIRLAEAYQKLLEEKDEGL